jgi:hypothetical protein
MKKSIRLASYLLLSVLLLSSCHRDKDDVPSPKNPNENELITTLKLVCVETGNSSNVVEATFRDIDGEGGMAPTIDTIRLIADKNYNVEIFLLDETKNPVANISDEIQQEADSHQFFFSVSNGADLSFMYSDTDKNGVPIGLRTLWISNAATTSTFEKVKIILKHQGADKPDSGNGNSAVGSTDIDVEFPILIK